MKFYFVRHGESEANKEGILAGGGCDTPLTELGRQQALAVQQKANALNFNIIYHSPMIRAQDTATIINQKKCVPLYPIDDFKEWDIGDWKGITQAELTDRVFNQGFHPINGERFDDFCDRIQRTIQSILDRESGPFMIVAHGGTFVAMTKKLNMMHNIKPVKNCAIIHCEYLNGRWYAGELES